MSSDFNARPGAVVNLERYEVLRALLDLHTQACRDHERIPAELAHLEQRARAHGRIAGIAEAIAVIRNMGEETAA